MKHWNFIVASELQNLIIICSDLICTGIFIHSLAGLSACYRKKENLYSLVLQYGIRRCAWLRVLLVVESINFRNYNCLATQCRGIFVQSGKIEAKKVTVFQILCVYLKDLNPIVETANHRANVTSAIYLFEVRQL